MIQLEDGNVIFANEGGGFIDPQAHLWTEIRKLEARLKEQEKNMRKAIRAIGEQMSEDFDFDDLISDIETPQAKVTPKPEVTPIEQVVALVDEVEAMDALDEMLATTEPSIDDVIEETKAVEEAQAKVEEVTDEVIAELEAEVQSLKEQLKSMKTLKQNVTVNNLPELEYSAEAKSFLKEYNAIEFEKKGLVQQTSDLKDKYKEMGVDCASAIKSQKEVIKELKETTEQAQIIESYKKLIQEDDDLMTDATMLSA